MKIICRKSDEFELYIQLDVTYPFVHQSEQIRFALGSPIVRLSHLEDGIPLNCDESIGQLQPQGQFISENMHKSVGTVELELAVHFLSD
ncbi:MAG: hypothetical protein EZS28_005213 [Streblomastix strix]|uniref:Uncharacterized protein n=1 Tax=Streblomastix strix TaxID=222440 RepID=A0A5J4WXH7_9EUKA|nr:MAG: hypothetical protein EZS28_005213 [Streblomastix strix]